MTEKELMLVVERILAKKNGPTRVNPYDELKRIHRRKFPASFLAIIKPLLDHPAYYKHGIDIIGNMKGAGMDASEAIELAWNRSWSDGIPQACGEAFKALLRIGKNDQRLIKMIEKAIAVDNYGIHRLCAETLMKVDHGDQLLKKWMASDHAKCNCHLHRKLATKIQEFLQSNE